MGLLPGAVPADVPPLALDPVAFRSEAPRPSSPPSPGEAADSATATAERKPFVLRQGVLVRIRVPAVGPGWIRARAARTASATPCILFELDISTPDGQKRYAMLRGVTAIEVDARMWDGPVMNLPPAEAEWTPVSLEEVRRQAAGCRR